MNAEEDTFFDQLAVVGTNHVASESQDHISEAFITHDPDVVAVELDEQRLQSLRRNEHRSPTIKLIPRIGVSGYIFVKLSYHLQRYLGRKVGVMPGAEMLHAAELAHRHGRELALIDRPMHDTLQALSNGVGVGEKARVVWDVITAPFTSLPVDIDPRRIPDEDTIDDIVSYIKQRYPSFHDAIIAQRDTHMAKELFGLLQDQRRVLAVVGAAHKNGLKNEIQALYEANPTPV